MAESLKIIKTRIRSIRNIEKVTSAMQMISATKLKRMDKALTSARPYSQRLESLLSSLTRGRDLQESPFFRQSQVKEKTTLCVITSDNGLCGAYNINIIRLAEEFMRNYGKDKIKLVIVGKKGYKHFKKFYQENIQHIYLGVNGKFSRELSEEIARYLADIFLSRQTDEVYIAYTHFETALINKPVVTKFLCIDQDARDQIDYIFDPDPSTVLGELVPEYLAMKIKFIMLEALTCEHASRLISMKMASENSIDLLHELTLLRNKVRQANITREIIEIISSAEALKG